MAEIGDFMKEWAKAFYKSQAWKVCRDGIWRRDGGLCQDCWRRGVLTPAEEVHHIKPLTPLNIRDPEISLNPSNLISLCRECHRARHAGETEKTKTHERYTVDEAGNVTIL